MDEGRINRLADKWLKRTITEPELKELEDWFAQDDAIPLEVPTDADENSLQYRLYDKIVEYNNLQSANSKHASRLWSRIAAAASILLLLSAGGYFLFYKQPVKQLVQNKNSEIAPGINKATLTLGNGQKIILTKGLSGKLAQQGNTLIQVNPQDALAYTAATASDNTPIEYNTMSTAKGEQSPFPLVLADGTKVWLNSQSSITFPTAFQGSERVVKVMGEAYFEVVHNSTKPFRVQAGGHTIEDIGTQFNVNAYDDEPVMKTTLIEGSVKISGLIIKPNQQAILNNKTGKIHLEKEVNTHIITAWKDGYFRFDLETLPTIMREFARWYNVEVIYEGQPTDQQFNMKVSRKSNLSRALLILNKGGVNYRLEGRKLFVKP